MEIKKLQIGDLNLHYADFEDFAVYLSGHLKFSNKQLIIVHINLRNYYFMNKDNTLYDNIKNNSIAVFEGIGLKVCAALKGFGFISDLNGTDLFPLFMKLTERTGHKFFLLGGSEKSLAGTIEHIHQNYPQVNVTGSHNGYFDEKEEAEIVKLINKSCADVLLISMGFPLQEKFVFKYRDKLNVSLIWNLGGLFDFLSGLKPRAPAIIRRMRFEWLYRFVKEPFRMFHRNTVSAVWSVGKILFIKKQ